MKDSEEIGGTTSRSVEDFKEIGETTSLNDVRRRFGPPDGDVGSGLYIYVYRLQDGSEVKIGASNPERILYVRHGSDSLFERSKPSDPQ